MNSPGPAPAPGDFGRDLAADLALCDAATPGPWEWRAGRHTHDPKTSDAGGIHTLSPYPLTLPDGRQVMNDNVAFPVASITGDPRWLKRLRKATALAPAPLSIALELIASEPDKQFILAAREGWPAALRRLAELEAELAALKAERGAGG